MKRFKLLILFLIFCLSLFARAQVQNYRMEGTFPFTPPTQVGPTNVNFNLIWSVRDGVIRGVYQDNYFSANTTVTGTSGMQGTAFLVNFPQTIQGVSGLSLNTNQANLTGGTTVVMVYARGPGGMSNNIANISASVYTQEAQAQENNCDVGFGVLSGYCGLYSGTVTENSDSANHCNLTANPGFRMELATNAEVSLYLNYTTSIIGLPVHTIGAFPSAPLTSTVDLTNRNCGPLPGTTFLPANCQAQTLSGTFSDVAGTKNFIGTYSIMDEITGDSCTYGLTLQRTTPY